MKFIIIIISILFTFLTYAQKSTFEKADCVFNNERIDSSNFKKIVNSLDSIISRYILSKKKYSELLDCLSSIDSSSPKLCWHKANHMSLKLNDTLHLNYYRYCIEKDFMVANSYYCIGAGYINYMLSVNEKDSLRISEITEVEKSRLYKLAENNAWLSYKSGLKAAVFLIGEIQKLKNENFITVQPRINLDQDTLTIVAQIRDCGEFGGHIETMSLINKGDFYISYFFSDSIYCMNEITIPSFNSKYNANNVIISKDYLIELINAIESYKDVGVLTNAPFEIAIVSNEHVLYQRIQDSRWPHYLEFRKKTFNF